MFGQKNVSLRENFIKFSLSDTILGDMCHNFSAPKNVSLRVCLLYIFFGVFVKNFKVLKIFTRFVSRFLVILILDLMTTMVSTHTCR